MKDLLLEIGTENIPAFYVEPAFRQLCEDAGKLLEELRLPYDEIYATGTPRRLVLMVHGLADLQQSAVETVTGPPVSKGFDDSGNPTRAAEGFARSLGVGVEQLETVDTPKGQYLGVRRELPRGKTTVLLAAALPAVIRSLRFPKTMRWEDTGESFARPIRWIVCLYGGEIVNFTFAGVNSGRTSFGRPWVRGERVTVRQAATYAKDVARLGVVVDDDQRRGRIVSQARKAAGKRGLVLVEDDGLFYELSFMLEDPRVLFGEFPQEYLRLPPEVVKTAMRSHQRYLAAEDRRGRLVPAFITFTDGPVLGPAGVRRGNEKVLRARLEDALFYWREDLKRGVDGLAGELERIVFIEGLGTLGQKVKRIAKLSGLINGRLDDAERLPLELIERASRLAKTDLASEMIKDGKEFTLLQGLIGSHYARECGEDPAVVQAVAEHYMPRTPKDPLPSTRLGAIVSTADRIDTVCGCFLAGLVPSGSQDPYGLRRIANGLLRISAGNPMVGIDELIESSVEFYVGDGFAGTDVAEAASERLRDFFVSRCEAFLKERGTAYDVVAAVARVGWMWPGTALERAREITRLRGDLVFERLITGVKRVGNILSKDKRLFGTGLKQLEAALGPHGSLSQDITFDSGMFTEETEHKLHQAVATAVTSLAESEVEGGFARVLNALSGLADPIDAYFDHVLVNCEDARVRVNRHNFLASVYAVFARYADFSYIVEEGPG